MSQILRLTRNCQAKVLSPYGISYASDSMLICKGCQMLRNEFSTNLKMKPESVVFRKKKWKKRENLYKKLTQSLDARLVQLSASPGNQLLSQRGDQSLYLLGNKTSKDGRVEQNVYFVGNSFNAEQITKLEREIELLRDKRGTQVSITDKEVPKGTGLTAELSHKPKAKLKGNAQTAEASTVIDKTKQNLQAISVINDKSKDNVQSIPGDFREVGSKVTENLMQNVDTGSYNIEVQTEGDLTHSLPAQDLTQTKADTNTSVIQFQDNASDVYKIWTEELHTKPSKTKLTESTVPRRKKIKKKKTSELKVVSKPAHVKSVDIAKTPVGSKLTDQVNIMPVNSAAVKDNTSITDLEGKVDRQETKTVKAKSATKAKHEKKLASGKTSVGDKLKDKAVVVDAETGGTGSAQGAETKRNRTKQSNEKKTTKKSEDKNKTTKKSEHKKKTTKKSEDKKKTTKKSEDLDKSVVESAIAIFNQDFRSFVDACCCVGLHDHALGCLGHYRNLNKAGYQKYKIKDVAIYNSIIKILAQKGDLRSIQELMSVMSEDGIKPDLQTYAMSLYCLSQNSDVDPVIAQYILSDMEREGFDVNKIFHKLPCVGIERDAVLKVLQRAKPGFEISPPEDCSPYSGPLVENLNTPLPRSEMVEPNPYAGVITPEEVMKKADKQFKRELDSYVYIKPIVPRLSKSDCTDKKHKKQAAPSKEKLAQLKKEWRHELTKGYREKLKRLEKKFNSNSTMNLYPFFKLLPEQIFVDLLMKVIHVKQEIEHLGSVGEFFSPPIGFLYRDLAQKICDRYHIQYMANNNIIPKVKKIYNKYTEKILDPDIDRVNHRTCWLNVQNEVTNGQSLESEEKLWSLFIKKALGKELYEIIISKVKVSVPQRGTGGQKKRIPAFVTVIRQKEFRVEEEILPHPQFLKVMSAQDHLMFPVSELPMLIPPLPWVAPTQGCNFFGTSKSIRWHLGKQMRKFKETSDAGAVLDSLNVIGACPWKVNQPVLDVIIQVFKSGGNDFLDIPVLPSSIEKPRKRKGKLPKEEKIKEYKEKLAYQKKENEATSLWYNSLYKFSIANMFRNEIFWFPHNMDFRGRTYALPPHFNQLGGDASRAIIKFAKGKPLGTNGLDWLKIHLVNLTGLKKKGSLAERLAFANEVMDEILDSADNPLEGRRWWTFSEEPWQTLACCMEIAEASRSEDPASYVSSYPVHQDGSCNGLQHYAALGRDTAGAKSVNLYPFGTPSDVYQEVVELVEQKRKKDLIEGDEKIKKAAEICEGHVERKVIKQTIMTTVYGVTKYGARLQIGRQLKERGMPDSQAVIARTYLADSTFHCLQQMFASAKQIQDWFNACATNISGIIQKPVEWVTPLNFPVVQPYFRQLQAKSYGVSVISSSVESQYPSVVKQKNAFAPNYIHSLDSTHMMLTSLYCLRAGITFVSVHDCFWTHPCDVEVMNKITREQFISLHNQPILENLAKYFVKTFCDTGLDSSASEAGNQSKQISQSDTLSLTEPDQSNNALHELDWDTNQSEDINVSMCDVTSTFSEIDSDQSNSVTDLDSEYHRVNNSMNHLDSDSVHLESSQSEDLLNLELSQSEKTVKQEGSSITSEGVFGNKRKLSENDKKMFLKKVLTSVPERGDFDLEKVKKSTYFFS